VGKRGPKGYRGKHKRPKASEIKKFKTQYSKKENVERGKFVDKKIKKGGKNSRKHEPASPTPKTRDGKKMKTEKHSNGKDKGKSGGFSGGD